eukprot:7894665-Alexandrium_andersonii.AAC.1
MCIRDRLIRGALRVGGIQDHQLLRARHLAGTQVLAEPSVLLQGRGRAWAVASRGRCGWSAGSARPSAELCA